MARKFRSDTNASENGKKRARANAESKFNGTKKKAEPRVLPDLLAATNGLGAEDIRMHFQTIKGFKTKCNEANAHYSNARKRCKEAGFDPKVITDLMKLEDQDPLEVALYFKQLDKGAQAVGLQLQMELPGTNGLSRNAQIYDDGWKAGKAAKAPDSNPHDINTPAGQLWLTAWHAAQAENASAFLPKDETAAEERTH